MRYDVYLTPEAEAAVPAGASEAHTLWRLGSLRRLSIAGTGPDTHPLALYKLRSAAPISLGKGLVDPEHTAAYEARASACTQGIHHSTSVRGCTGALIQLPAGRKDKASHRRVDAGANADSLLPACVGHHQAVTHVQ